MPTLTYPHWRDLPATAWRWPNFSADEIACRGTGAIWERRASCSRAA